MRYIYSFGIKCYAIGVRLASLFNPKARQMLTGWKRTFGRLAVAPVGKGKTAWFHASSLGEFEQARPVLEEFRKRHPEYRICVTFFSPSGFEVRKNYPNADFVCYLPMDTRSNAIRFVNLLRPSVAFFAKYDFWFNYLEQLRSRNVPTYIFSSIFRPNQYFFKWYGKWFLQQLGNCFTHIFVQNEESLELLQSHGVEQVSIAGDTRFDRVHTIALEAQQNDKVEQFLSWHPDNAVLLAGSSWEPDEDLIIPYFNDLKNWKLILAPHVVSDSHIKNIISKLNCKVVRYTEATAENVKDAKCLLIDCYGLLSSVYRYGDISYVGGGFGVGIHNLLEAAIYGIPVVFGPNNQRFQEAQDLKACGGGFEISDVDSFTKCMDRLIRNSEELKESGNAAGTYVNSRIGATELIMKAIFKE